MAEMLMNSDAMGLDAQMNVPVPVVDGSQAPRAAGYVWAAPFSVSRQKSCNNCVRGKRRCDKQTPRCGRCTAKNVECTYKRGRQPRHEAAAAAAVTPSFIPMPVPMPMPAAIPVSTSAVAPLFVPTSSVSAWSAATESAPVPIAAAAGGGGIDPDLISLECADSAFDMPPLGDGPSDSLELGLTLREAIAGPESGAAGISPWDMHLGDPSLNVTATTAATRGSHSGSSDNGDDSTNKGVHLTSVGSSGSRIYVDIPLPPDAIRAALAALAAPDPLDDFFFSIDPDLVHDPRSKIGFVVHELTQMHHTFARRRAAHFIHPRLYASGVPRSMVLAFAAVSAYAGHTRETKGWALKAVQYAVREVYRDAKRPAAVSEQPGGAAGETQSSSSFASSSSSPGTSGQLDGSGSRSPSNVNIDQGGGAGLPRAVVREKLARLQALVLLNCMRIFDGDVSSRSAAEREMGVMVSWTRELVEARREMEEGLPPSMLISRDRLPRSWGSWILLESLRRTTVTAMAVVFLLCVLRDGSTPCHLWAEDESFTASRHLWEAQTSMEFFRAWREKPQFCVTNMMFRDFWSGAQPDDLDDFTKMMVIPQVGVEVIEHFVMGEATAAA